MTYIQKRRGTEMTVNNLLTSSRNIETLVKQYQSGVAEAFTEIYAAFANDRKTICYSLRKSLPSVITDSDIQAIYDDSLLTAADCYCYQLGGKASFKTYLYAIVRNNRLNAIRYATQKKRDCTIQLVSTIVNGEGQEAEATETLHDPESMKLFEQAEGCPLLEQLQEYGTVNRRTALNSVLIAWDTLGSFSTATAKYEYMRRITGLTGSDCALRKRIQRAKADFKLWLQVQEGDYR